MPPITATVEASDTTSKPTECPTPDGCQAKAPPTGGGTEPGSTEEPEEEEEEECPPHYRNCLKPLTAADSAVLNEMWADMRVSYSDTLAARICAELKSTFLGALQEKRVFRGNISIPDGPVAHAGWTFRGKMHIDGEYFDLAADTTNPSRLTYRKYLLQMALHEAAHLAGYEMHGDEVWGSYTTFPYNHTTGGGGVETCVA